MRLTPRVAGFRSEYPAGFKLECMAGFVGTRTLAHAPGFSSLFDGYLLTENLHHYRGDIALAFTTTTRIAGLTSAKLTIERRVLVSDLVFIGLVIRLI